MGVGELWRVFHIQLNTMAQGQLVCNFSGVLCETKYSRSTRT